MSRRHNRPGNIRSTLAAFLRMDFMEDISYPLSFAFGQLGALAPVVIYFFVARLVGSERRVGGDYFTFVVIGFSIATMLQGALSGFGGSLQRALDRGTFETFLVEPVRWTFLPFAMNLWRSMLGAFTGTLVLAAGLVLGADYRAAGIPEFLVLLLLGIAASTGIGILSASVVVLAKRAQPIVAMYGLAASLLAGVLFSVDLLPGWLRALSWLVPHTYAINAAREVLMHTPVAGAVPFGSAVIALLVFIVLSFIPGLWALSRSLEYARKLGTLSGY
ncbi:MAG: ABC transporter permease [Acidimicrobiia bacterium]